MHWAGRERFVIFDGAFLQASGLPERFLRTWAAWRADPGRPRRLHYIAFMPAHGASVGSTASSAWAASLAAAAPEGHGFVQCPQPTGRHPHDDLLTQLAAVWPVATPDLHRVSLDDGRVELLLSLARGAGDRAAPARFDPRDGANALLKNLVAEVDAFFIEGDHPEFKRLARVAAPGATLSLSMSVSISATSAGADLMKPAVAAGFKVIGTDGPHTLLATYEPIFRPRRPAGRVMPARREERRAIIIGAGLAGCSAALALAQDGWSSTLIDRRSSIAAETSGNPGGLFHGIVNADDGVHARFNRAASLEAFNAVRIAIDQHDAAGQIDGLLRLETTRGSVADMQKILDGLGLPPEYVRAVAPEEASRLSGLPVELAAWWYARGGWVDPTALARSFIERTGAATRLRLGVAVDRLVRDGEQWVVLDDTGAEIDRAKVIVLANAGDCTRMLARSSTSASETITSLGVDLARVRGQISLIAADTPGLRTTRVPVAGAGYALPPSRGLVLTGASSDVDDEDRCLRTEDHRANLASLAALTGSRMDIDEVVALTAAACSKAGVLQVAAGQPPGRVGWRTVAPDRLPLIGAVPRIDTRDAPARREQPRMVPREPGLFVFTGLGSRGITWAALGGRILASWIAGSPFPVDSKLIDAVDAARFVSRGARRT